VKSAAEAALCATGNARGVLLPRSCPGPRWPPLGWAAAGAIWWEDHPPKDDKEDRHDW